MPRPSHWHSITGSFPTADAAFDPARNTLELALRLDDAIRFDLADTVPVIVTDEDVTKLRVDNVMDLVEERPMNLIHGRHVFRVAGFNMVLTDEGSAAYLENARGTTFPLVVDEVVSKQLFKAHTAGLKPILAQTVLTSLEGFILQELAKGRRLDFNLVSFYPRLSGALSSRDSDPESDGLFVRGAVKARRMLVNGLKRSLEAENGLAVAHPRITNILDRTVDKFDVVASGHELSAAGRDIRIDPSREDEGVWLEKDTRKGSVKIARGHVLETTQINLVFVFDDPIPRGKYFVTICTRGGRGTDYSVIRCRREVTAI